MWKLQKWENVRQSRWKTDQTTKRNNSNNNKIVDYTIKFIWYLSIPAIALDNSKFCIYSYANIIQWKFSHSFKAESNNEKKESLGIAVVERKILQHNTQISIISRMELLQKWNAEMALVSPQKAFRYSMRNFPTNPSTFNSISLQLECYPLYLSFIQFCLFQ